ncbi:polyphosphate:AMP phosphotransferase [Methanolobus sediminis]|uniref:Polyphosphate:AMP phosphotransferase n=1 Tax=Methanolobus sediminis TaxID=3072978 RepID=A0AA51ULN4_9EURY|nr:polyphosphate:AMP phosphotransferase [Methanolobus sediminis]WMW25562.1 polyphosphate:AMP phosphotransferase [Methanolobus sediminis]
MSINKDDIMLENVDLTKTLPKDEYKTIMEDLEIRMGELQRKAWKMDIPIIIVFEGWHASGMSEIINRFLLTLSPMGFNLYTTERPCYQEEQKPLLWRFWTKIPEKGRMVIFDRSWYRRIIIEHNKKGKADKDMNKCIEGLTYFERQLTDGGYLVIKLFLHISKEEQNKRYQEMKDIGIPQFIIEEEERDYLDGYDKYLPLIEGILEKTDRSFAPWTIVEANDRGFATVKVLSKVIESIEYKIQDIENKALVEQNQKMDSSIIPNIDSSILEKIDLDKSLTYEEYKKEKKKCQKKLKTLQYDLFRNRTSLIVVFEGWDAAGKGGSIRRLVKELNPRLYQVTPVGVPTPDELRRHYLWRFYNQIPEAGHIGIYDRSWYGRVLVERVEDLCNVEEWKRAYREINEFEETLSNYGTIIVKFWMHIDKDEQLRRFKQRDSTEYKQWKITPDDWRNREKWNLYLDAADEMLKKTSTTWAPWTIVESNDKYYSRIKVMNTVIDRIENKLRERGLQ